MKTGTTEKNHIFFLIRM